MATISEIRNSYPQYNDLSDQQIADALHSKYYADMPRQDFDAKIGLSAAKPQTGMVKSAVAGAAQGGLLSFADEAYGAIKGMYDSVVGNKPVEQTYSDNLNAYRQQDKAAYESNPGTYIAGSIGGALATTPLMPIAPAATMAGNIVKGAEIGAGYGAVAGFGAGEGGVVNRAQSAGEGAIGGALVGAALPPAAAGAVRGGSVVADKLAGTQLTRLIPGRSAEDAADRILANRIKSSGQTPQSIIDDFDQGAYSSRLHSNSNANLPEMIADTSNGLQRLTGSVYRAGGEGAETVKTALQSRQRGPENPYAPKVPGAPQGQAEDIIDATDRALTVDSLGSALGNERAILAKQKADGNRLYGEARQNSEPFDLSPVVSSMKVEAADYPGTFGNIMRRAASYFERQGNPVDNIESFDKSKKALDDLIDTAQRQGANALVRELTAFKNKLLDAVHLPDAKGNATRNIKYSEARSTWGTAAEQREAIEMGRAALRDGSEITVESYRAMTPYQQTLFRIGLKQGVRNLLATKRPGNDVTQVFQQRRVQQLLADVIPRTPGKKSVFNDRPQRFGEYMRRQQRMVETNRKALGGSETAERLSDDAQFAADAVGQTANVIRGGANAALELVATGFSKIFGMRQDVAASLATRLVESQPQQRIVILKRLEAKYGPDRVQEFMNKIYRRAGQAGAAGASVQAGD